MTTSSTGTSGSGAPLHAPSAGQHIVIVEDDEALGREAAECISRWGSTVHRLYRPDDAALRRRLQQPVDGIAMVTRDDIVALRYALLAEHLRPGIRLVVTLFDRTVADEVSRTIPNCSVLSITDTIVPSLLASCLDPRYAVLQTTGSGVVGVPRQGSPAAVEHVSRRSLTAAPKPRPRAGVTTWFRSLDISAQALVAGFTGLLLALALDILLGVSVLHEHGYDALWNAARALTTIGSSPAAEHGPAWYKVLSALSMLAVLALAALFTAGLVDQLTGRRMTSILGARSIPRRDHVIVVGLGQVGLRLCAQLRDLGIKVVAVERNPQAGCVPLARSRAIPVVLGRGGDRFLLNRLGVRRARALAAVGSDGLENIAVAVTTRAVAPRQRIVLRAGGDEVTADSQSLFRIGAVCDVTGIVGASVAASVLGTTPLSVFLTERHTCALFPDEQVIDLGTWDAGHHRQTGPAGGDTEEGTEVTDGVPVRP
ncbi:MULTISPECIES: NAD(P)-binding protein [unclassified Streptomyces]|uniref:NAD(P)-binding protein n=1 Tax=unclassified Streptomyces TaxID=2593676 RepID=UPI001F03367B|nr:MULTISPECIES: NAD(P)-binding protein [unclassified Streptomyces]